MGTTVQTLPEDAGSAAHAIACFHATSSGCDRPPPAPTLCLRDTLAPEDPLRCPLHLLKEQPLPETLLRGGERPSHAVRGSTGLLCVARSVHLGRGVVQSSSRRSGEQMQMGHGGCGVPCGNPVHGNKVPRPEGGPPRGPHTRAGARERFFLRVMRCL